MTMTKTKKSATIDGVSDRPEPDQEAVERVAGLLRREELKDALKGLDPDQITGPGGAHAARGPRDRGRVGRGADRSSRSSAGSGAAGRCWQSSQRSTTKTLQTDLGPGRHGTFEPGTFRSGRSGRQGSTRRSDFTRPKRSGGAWIPEPGDQQRARSSRLRPDLRAPGVVADIKRRTRRSNGPARIEGNITELDRTRPDEGPGWVFPFTATASWTRQPRNVWLPAIIATGCDRGRSPKCRMRPRPSFAYGQPSERAYAASRTGLSW